MGAAEDVGFYSSATLGTGEYLKHPGHGAGVQDFRFWLYITERPWRKTRTRLIFFYAGRSYQRSRLYRSISAISSQPYIHDWHRAIAKIGRGYVPDCRRRPLPRTHGGSPCYQYPP